MAVNVLIAFYSRDGSTEALANALAEGAREAGAEVRLRRARELVGPEVMAHAPGWAEKAEAMNARYEAPTTEDCEWADAIAFGSPTRFGNVAAELKAFVDGLGGLWFQGKLLGKAGAAFCATATAHGGAESTLLTTYNFMAHLGLIIVPIGYGDPVMFRAGTPYGAHAAVDGQYVTAVPEDELVVARHQGKRLVAVAGALKAAHQTETH
jgi:NAD(P)H dehydrogenase (quinone)